VVSDEGDLACANARTMLTHVTDGRTDRWFETSLSMFRALDIQMIRGKSDFVGRLPLERPSLNSFATPMFWAISADYITT
jgi:hypothetical protein